MSVHNVLNRSWKPLLKRAGLPVSTRFHHLDRRRGVFRAHFKTLSRHEEVLPEGERSWQAFLGIQRLAMLVAHIILSRQISIIARRYEQQLCA